MPLKGFIKPSEHSDKAIPTFVLITRGRMPLWASCVSWDSVVVVAVPQRRSRWPQSFLRVALHATVVCVCGYDSERLSVCRELYESLSGRWHPSM